MDAIEKGSDFDADVVISNSAEIFGPIPIKPVENQPELDVSLRLQPSNDLRRAKRRMEYSFMDDYSLKMKAIKRVDRPKYEGEYTFIVRVAVDDSNTVEIRDAFTMCKLRKVEDESYKSEEEYKPESEVESVSDVDDERQRSNREAHLFDPEKQITKYNKIRLPRKIPVIEIDEKPSETAEYHWLKNYEVIPSNSLFNRFLNKFKNGYFAPKVAEFQGIRYRFLRVGTNAKLNTVRQFNQFIIGNNFSIFRLGMNGSPNVDLGVCSKAREKRLPLPINKKFTIASLFWANELLKTQKAW